MVLYTFIKKIKCVDSEKCSIKIKNTLKEKFKLVKEKDGYNFAITAVHEPNNHLISIFFCDSNGKEDTPRIKHTAMCNDKVNYDAKLNYLIKGQIIKCGINIVSEQVEQKKAVKCKSIPSMKSVMDSI